MGIYINISNSMGKTIFQIKESSYSEPKSLMKAFEASKWGEGILFKTNSGLAQELVEHFKAHLSITPQNAKKFGIDAERPDVIKQQVQDLITYWTWGLLNLKKAMRTHKTLLLYVG